MFRKYYTTHNKKQHNTCTYNTHLVRHSHKAQSAYKNKVINYSYNYTILLN